MTIFNRLTFFNITYVFFINNSFMLIGYTFNSGYRCFFIFYQLALSLFFSLVFPYPSSIYSYYIIILNFIINNFLALPATGFFQNSPALLNKLNT